MLSSKEVLELIKSDNIEAFVAAYNAGEIDLNAIINEKLNRTIIHEACRNDAEKITKWLIDSGVVDLNSRDIDNKTPLILASMFEKTNIVKLLVETESVDVDAVQLDGKNAYLVMAYVGNKVGMGLVGSRTTNKKLKDKSGAGASDLLDNSQKTRTQVSAASEVKSVKDISQTLKSQSPVEKSANTQSSVGQEDSDGDAVGPDPASMTQEEIIAHLEKMGFINISAESENESYIGRDAEAEEVAKLAGKSQNILINADVDEQPGTLIYQVAHRLKNKTILKIGGEHFRGDKWRGGVNEKIKAWLPYLLALKPNAILYVEELNQFVPSKNDDSSDNPAELLKSYMDDIGSERIQIIGVVTPNQYEKMLENSPEFIKLFYSGANGGYQLQDMPPEDVKKILTSPQFIEKLKQEGYSVGDLEHYSALVAHSVLLLDNYIFNQRFPLKAVDFIKTILAERDSDSIDIDFLEDRFCKKYTVPKVDIDLDFKNSPYNKLEAELLAVLEGQEAPIREMVSVLKKGALTRSSKTRKPLSMFLAGPPGVGKSQSAKIISKTLFDSEDAVLTVDLGSIKSFDAIEKLKEDITQFLRNNYAGVIILDEIEKANPQTVQILMGFLNDGVLGAGKSRVQCGNVVVIATSNVEHEFITGFKQVLKESDPLSEVPIIAKEQFPNGDSLPLRITAGLIREGVASSTAPALMSRMTNIIDFNPLFRDTIIKICKKKLKSMSKERAITEKFDIDIDDDCVAFMVKSFEPIELSHGVRSVEEKVVKAIDSAIMSNPDVEIHRTERDIKHIKVHETKGIIKITITLTNDEKIHTKLTDLGAKDAAISVRLQKAHAAFMANARAASGTLPRTSGVDEPK